MPPVPTRRSARRTVCLAFASGSSLALLAATDPAFADDNPLILQLFETRWNTIEYRTPDIFMAGYDSLWLPGFSKTSDPNGAGYDPFDRFDLGSPGSETAFGTFGDVRAMVDELHQAGLLVYPESIMNHNSGRTSDQGFINAGGWPGFVHGRPSATGGKFWGDFHDGSTQSENPGGANYNLFEGDLVSLIDIAQEENFQFIRHPTEDGNPNNIPAGTIFNRPNPANAALYPDLDLPARSFVNPATGNTINIHPYNLADPMAGDPVTENATGLLVRWTQWMVEVVGVDGFRLDAAKHIPQFFWNDFWDNAVFENRTSFAGNAVTPFSFGESVAGNGFIQTYIRKDGFGNRDALDINAAGTLRDIHNARGFISWSGALSNALDTNDDGFNNGSQGVRHVLSHDNGSAGDGGSEPPLPGPDSWFLPQFAKILFMPGTSIVYHNSREFVDIYAGAGRFWPREGLPIALGLDEDHMVTLARISNGYSRGQFFPLNGTDPVIQSTDDVLVWERRSPNGAANVLVAVNDRYDSGTQSRNVQTAFAPGTRLHELTGNAADPAVDTSNTIPELLIVDGTGRVTITVPNNRNTNGVEHHRGYVVYGPAAPSGTLELFKDQPQPTLFGVLPPDGPGVPSYARRLTELDIVTDDSFLIRLVTTKTDGADPAWDDNAVFRIDSGYRDFNENGSIDNPQEGGVNPGYEDFTTISNPLTTTGTTGIYLQRIDTTLLDEGIHYLSVLAFRERPAGTDPILTDFRRVFYVDREPPAVDLASTSISDASQAISVIPQDRTTDSVHVLINPPDGVDPLTLVAPANAADAYDRFEWRRDASLLDPGENTVVVIAFEITGNVSVTSFDVSFTLGSGDVDKDGVVTVDDLHLATEAEADGTYVGEADMNTDGQLNIVDLRILEARVRGIEAESMSDLP